MKKIVFVICAALTVAVAAAAQPAASSPSQRPAAKPAPALAIEPPNSRFVRTLTNVHIELTLTDQLEGGTPQKKTVSMVVASGSWGKIRNSAASNARFAVGLNVDARPWVSTEGPVQLELTIHYYPPQGDAKSPGTPTELNQSVTVVLHSGKPMQISQSADPASDRKVTVDVKATVLK